ncbi:holes in muscle [Cochliomyia hominivorax]
MGIMYKLMKHRNLNMDLNKTQHSHHNHHLNNKNIKSERNRLITIEGNIIDNPDSAKDSSEPELGNKNMDTNMDKQFTAEHIIQLCKFLAEKSKRNKNLYKQQQSPKKLIKSKTQTQFQFQQMDYEDNDESDLYQNEALPLLSQQRLEQQQQQQQQKQERRNHNTDDENDDDDDNDNDNDNVEDNEFDKQKISAVLSTRLSPDINSLNISLNTTANCATQNQQQHLQHFNQHHQQQHIFNYHHLSQQHNSHSPQNQGKRDILLKIRKQIFERKRLRENGAFEPQALNNSAVWRPW